MEARGRLRLMACDSGRIFAQRVAAELTRILEREGERRFELTRSQEVLFANREVKTVLDESVRGDDVYVVQCMDDPLSERSVNDNLMALCTALGAAREGDAECITAVLPHFPYARQERKKARESITARQVARFLEISGADRVLTLDLHAEAICGFFERATLDNLRATQVILAHFRTIHSLENLTVVSPDIGSADRARSLSRQLGCDIAICDKERDYSKPGVVKSARLVGDVRERDVLMVDDMIATAGSIIEAAQTCRKAGARAVYLGCSHPFFNGEALRRLDDAYAAGVFKLVLGTDSVVRGEPFALAHPWYQEVSVAPLVAQVLFHINRRQSVSTLMG